MYDNEAKLPPAVKIDVQIILKKEALKNFMSTLT